MPVSISRLRIWFAVMALLIAAVVAGFYGVARYRMRGALKNLPSRIGVDIQQTSEGFSLSKSEGGHTLFTIRASKATQFKTGGRAELHNVNITVYGHNSDRYDQIYGDDFEYDQPTGAVIAKGEVHIDMAANKEVQGAADQTAPPATKEPVHVRLQGLVFDQGTGMAHTDGEVEFQVPQASGTARGATYDSKKNELTLLSDIAVQTAGKQAMRIVARHGQITKEPRLLTLESADMTSSGRRFLADSAILDLAADNSVQTVHAAGNVRLSDPDGLAVRSPRAEMKLGEHNLLDTALFYGGVDLEDAGRGTTGRSGRMLLHFAPQAASGHDAQGSQAELKTVYASEGVSLRRAAQQSGKDPQDMTLTSSAVTLHVSGGRVLASAQTEGPGRIVSQGEGANAGERTTVDAQHFTAEFAENNLLRVVHGVGQVRSVMQTPGQPEKVSTSNTMVAYFAPGGEISRVVQEGDFRFREGQSSRGEPGGRTSFADRATYSPQNGSLTLQGNPRIVDGGMTVTADTIRLLRTSSEAFAQGNVKTTYSELKVQPDGALLASSDPVHVTAKAMNAQQSSGLAHYTGGARLWQGSNIVEAPTIDFDQKARTIVALGDAQHPVSSVFLQVDAKGKSSLMVVTSARLDYADNQRLARYTGGVKARGDEGVMTANRADIFLNPASHASVAGPSQLDHIVASQHVVVQQGERRAQGEQLLYTASTGSFVMTGGSPMLSDPVNGTVHGDSLTFYSRNDRVVVEGDSSSRVVTHTHVSR